jgi:DNA polymerase-3 subunit alpha
MDQSIGPCSASSASHSDLEDPKFIHLRLHSQYSIVDSIVDVDALFDMLSAKKMPAVALTDECNLYAAVKFYKRALSSGIKPIFGTDLWILDGEEPSRLTVLCQNNQGLSHLMILISKAYLNADRREGIPLIPIDWLTPDNLEGLIALSGGIEGKLGQALLREESGIEALLEKYQSLFPDNRFYLEISRQGRVGEKRYGQKIISLAQQYDMPLVATSLVCFLKKEDFDAHEVRVAVGKGEVLDGSQKSSNYLDTQYLQSCLEMEKAFLDLPEALLNTVQIAKRCNVNLTLGKVFLPDFPVPEGQTMGEYLRDLSSQGLKNRLQHAQDFLGQNLDQEAYFKRLEIELEVIIKMGFSGYFLIVSDFIQWSKNHDIPVGPGRGSGAGSIVAYALKITDIDPIPYDLLFERFLNPERVSMPDFDVDFCMEGRDRVIDYVAEKYGRESVSQIITFGSMAAKAALRDVGRVMGLGYGFVDKVAKLVPNELGITLQDALKDPSFKEKYENDDEVRPLVDMALRLEGTVRNVGKHAGGVVIAPSALSDFSPIYCEEGSKQIVSQFDKDDVEAIGLVKFDFLGLRNLTIIKMALKTVNKLRQDQGEETLFIENIPLNDPESFTLLKRCQTTAVFQLESRGMKDLIRRLQPDSFEEIIALVALFRPGPLQSGMVDDFIERKHGRAPVIYDHPDLKEILQTTYGIILYQEQVMKIAQVLANYTLGGADLLRRAMGKKKPEEMAQQREIFLKGASDREISPELAGKIFDLMEKFAGYGFNKSHSAAYALVSYQTAYLKAHYPSAFMAAVLSSDMDNTDKVVIFIEDCENLGLAILPPDIHASEFQFTVQEFRQKKAIRFGLGAVKGVGLAALESIFEERAKGNFKDLFDFCARINLRKANRRVLEALIYSGAMDALGPSRESLYLTLDSALMSADQNSRNLEKGQSDIFGNSEVEIPALQFLIPKEIDLSQRLFHEKQVLGFFLSGHPMKLQTPELLKMGVRPLNALSATAKGKVARVAGLLVGKRQIKTKQGKIMMILSIEDGQTRREVMVFSEVLDRYKEKLVDNSLILIEGEISPDDFSQGLRIVSKDIYTFSEARARYARALKIKLHSEQVKAGIVAGIKQLLEPHRGGQTLLIIEYENDQAKTTLRTQDWSLQLKGSVLDDLLKLLKESGFELIY